MKGYKKVIISNWRVGANSEMAKECYMNSSEEIGRNHNTGEYAVFLGSNFTENNLVSEFKSQEEVINYFIEQAKELEELEVLEMIGEEKMLVKEIIEVIEGTEKRTYWGKAVKEDAINLLEELEVLEISSKEELKELVLNGARDWSNYSYGGCALIYDCDIAEHYCTPSELKKKRGGELAPNRNETWLDVQARALYQAWLMIACAVKEVK